MENTVNPKSSNIDDIDGILTPSMEIMDIMDILYGVITLSNITNKKNLRSYIEEFYLYLSMSIPYSGVFYLCVYMAKY